MLTSLRRCLGIFRATIHLAKGALLMLTVMPSASAQSRRRIVARWSRRALAIFAIDLRLEGAPPVEATGLARVVVANHISWIDIFAGLSVTPMRFVAKSEVRSWPLIGWFATRLGTIFVERDRPRDAVRVTSEIRAALAAGDIVCIFPEGTTTDGSVVLPFSAVLFGPAVELDAEVTPLSIAYRTPSGEPCRRVAFTGDATLVASIWELAAGARSNVHVSFLKPVAGGSLNRRGLARATEDAVRESLGHPPRPNLVGPAPAGAPVPGHDRHAQADHVMPAAADDRAR